VTIRLHDYWRSSANSERTAEEDAEAAAADMGVP